MTRYRVWSGIVFIISILLVYFVWSTQANPESSYRFKLGLDLAGGTELIYKADMTEIPVDEREGALASLQEVIERRVNLFGVAEPLVQTQRANILHGVTEDRLIVALPGVTDIDAAVDALGKTPMLEFRLEQTTDETEMPGYIMYAATGLTGRYLESASLQFGTGATAGLTAPQILLNFNYEGAKLFEKITTENVGRTLAIFLDQQLISTPVIQEPIPGGQATITGQFTAVEARELVRNLNFGALPVPMELQSSSVIGPTLGAAAITAGITAGIVGFIIIALFMIFWYRLPGTIAALSLAGYLAIVLAVIKIIPITLTASGIAGLIVSVGIAIDANVLIFERIKEELRNGKMPREAVHIGFSRAWPAIRDGNVTTIISGVILFWLGTNIVQGFALVFVLGVLASFISAVTITRLYLLATVPENQSSFWRRALSSGFRNSASNI